MAARLKIPYPPKETKLKYDRHVSPEPIVIVLYFWTVEVCQDVDEAPSVFVVGDTSAVVTLPSEVRERGIRHRVFRPEVVQENT